MISLLVLIVILLLIGGGVWAWPLIAGLLGLSSATDKPSALKSITQLMNTYDITPAEVETEFHAPSSASAESKRSKGDVAKTLFIYLGAIFIGAGISTYVGTFWDTMGSAMRIFLTLGVGYALLIVLVSALHENQFPKLVMPITLACVVMMTGGWFVFLDEMFPDSDNWRAATLFVCGVLAVQKGALFGKYHRTVLAFTTLIFIYGFMHVGLDMLGLPIAYIAIILGASVLVVSTALEKSSHRVLSEPALLIGVSWLNSGLFDRIAMFTSANWASLVTGVCLMLTAYGLYKADRYPRLIALGYLIGSIMAYSGLFDLIEHTSAELLFLAVTASVLYLCVVLESRALLFTTVIAMLSFIGYYSAEHFSDSLGWPLTLVLIGVAFLSVGAIALKVKRRI